MLKKRYDLKVGAVKTYDDVGKVRSLELWVYDSETDKWKMDIGTIPLYVSMGGAPKWVKASQIGWYIYYKYMKEALSDPETSCIVTLCNGTRVKCFNRKEAK